MRSDVHPSDAPSDRLRSELARQRSILVGEAPVRFVATALGYAITALFLPVLFVAAIAAVNLIAEIISDRLLRDIERLVHSRQRRLGLVLCTVVHEACFVLPPALMWHLDDPYVKAYAVGMTASTMMHIATVRAIYLPMGLGGALSIWIIVLSSNALHWSARQDWVPLAVTTVCALGALGYFLSALLSNNRLHRETSAGRAEAVAANAAKTRFLAQMSHELRTPLNAILGMGHAELMRQTDPVSRERLELLVESAAGLGVLLDDILDMAAVQEGRLPIRPVALDPRAVISDTVALFRPQVESAGLTLDLTLDPGLPVAGLADGRRLRRCLSNILSNALKYTAEGGIWVAASFAPGGVLRIEVIDSGEGVPTELRDAIFEPFLRGPGAQAGTGLGLAISRTLARRMDGDLVILPSDQGARFCLTLAMGRADLQHLAPPAVPSDLSLQHRHILVVDDIATNRLVAATYLRLFGAEVSEAASGAAALEMVRQAVPSAILLDMNMPDMSGIETLRQLREMGPEACRIPVIAMTADATEAHRNAYLAAGMDGYVAKPLSPERLIEVLRPHFAAPTPADLGQRKTAVG